MMLCRFRGWVRGLVLILSASTVQATDLSGSIAGSVGDGAAAIPYRLFEPAGAATDAKKPLVVFLHGMGDRGTDNVRQTDAIGDLVRHTRSGANASYVLAPQINADMWFQSFGGTPTEATALSLKAVREVIATQNVDAGRVYVTGVSMGGMGAWDIVARDPGLFAAAVPIAGGGDVKTAGHIKDVPVWAFHGGADTVVPVSATRDMVDALKDAGGDVRYTEVQGGDHVIWDDVYADGSDTLYPWLFAQRRASAELSRAVGDVSAIVPGAVPEPGALALLGVGGMLILRRRRR
jgi:predicted peptidase